MIPLKSASTSPSAFLKYSCSSVFCRWHPDVLQLFCKQQSAILSSVWKLLPNPLQEEENPLSLMCPPQTQGPSGCEEKKGLIILWISIMVTEEKEGKPRVLLLGWDFLPLCEYECFKSSFFRHTFSQTLDPIISYYRRIHWGFILVFLYPTGFSETFVMFLKSFWSWQWHFFLVFCLFIASIDNLPLVKQLPPQETVLSLVCRSDSDLSHDSVKDNTSSLIKVKVHHLLRLFFQSLYSAILTPLLQSETSLNFRESWRLHCRHGLFNSFLFKGKPETFTH